MKSPFLIYVIAAVVIVGTGIAIFAVTQPFQTKAETQEPESKPTSPDKILAGPTAPYFTLPSTTGSTISLSDYSGKKNVLLYFQEGIMCAPCWEQIEDIQKEYDKFKPLDIELVTVTVDPLNALTKETEERGITLPVLEDGDLSVSKAYDVLDYSMHPGSRPGHSFVLVGKDGDIVWRKDYYPAGVNVGGMNMNTGGKMYVPVDELLREIYKIAYRLYPDNSNATGASSQINDTSNYNGEAQNTINPSGNTTMIDHSMCLTPIHKHADFKVYLNGNPLNLTQRKYMDQSSDVHFHPTVKVNPDDVPGIPFADMVHMHKENMTISDLLNTLDFDNATSKMLSGNSGMLMAYANGELKPEGLDYVMQDKDRILVSYYDDTSGIIKDDEIAKQIDSVTNYAIMGKDKNLSLFGGC